MHSNFLRMETGVMRKQRGIGIPAKKAPSRKTGYTARSGIDDFLRRYPVSTVNEYGDRVISGRRIC